MVLNRQTSHNPNQCWLGSMTPYSVIRSHWVIQMMLYFNGLVQDCCNSSAFAMELLQFCTKPSICPCSYFVLHICTLANSSGSAPTLRRYGNVNHITGGFPLQRASDLELWCFLLLFLNENVWILIKISLNFVPKGPVNNIPALIHIMAWPRPGAKPLSEPMMGEVTDAYMRHLASTRWKSFCYCYV